MAVIRKLKMEQDRFQVAFVGGVFAAGELIVAPLREQVMRVARKAFIGQPSFSQPSPPAVWPRNTCTDCQVAVLDARIGSPLHNAGSRRIHPAY